MEDVSPEYYAVEQGLNEEDVAGGGGSEEVYFRILLDGLVEGGGQKIRLTWHDR